MSVFSRIASSLLTSAIAFSGTAAVAYSIAPVTNGDFQSSTTLDGSGGWTGVGSTQIGGTYSGVDYNSTNQGIVTTACPSGDFTVCSGSRNDDPGTTTGTFNLQTQDQLSASPEIAVLQSQLGLDPNSFSVFRTINGVTYDGTGGNPVLRRTPKEGSAIFQQITVNNDGSPTDTLISFNYDFLTNDGAGSLGNKDFGFISISGNGVNEVVVLEDSVGNITSLSGSDYATNTNPYQSIQLERSLAPGNYTIGFGTIDVDGVGYSSALLVDDFAVEEVPFEFTPATGIALVLGLLSWKKLRQRRRS